MGMSIWPYPFKAFAYICTYVLLMMINPTSLLESKFRHLASHSADIKHIYFKIKFWFAAIFYNGPEIQYSLMAEYLLFIMLHLNKISCLHLYTGKRSQTIVRISSGSSLAYTAYYQTGKNSWTISISELLAWNDIYIMCLGTELKNRAINVKTASIEVGKTGKCCRHDGWSGLLAPSCISPSGTSSALPRWPGWAAGLSGVSPCTVKAPSQGLLTLVQTVVPPPPLNIIVSSDCLVIHWPFRHAPYRAPRPGLSLIMITIC